LEKLLGARSFNGFINHISYRQAILLTSLSGFGLHFIVQIVALAFFECWALIVLALIICFQQDDHPILLDVVTHVEIDISSF
jgi:hypothetical protein